MTWSLPHLVDALGSILLERAEALRLEQAVRGLDHADERAIQALLAAGLERHYTVERERHYPSSEGKLSHRPRCDLVLTPTEGAPLWLEVKVAHQLKEGGRRNARYGPQWQSAIVADLRKLKADPAISHAALLLVAFTEDEAMFDKDSASFEQLLLDEDLLAGWRSTLGFPIEDRIGHRRCSLALWPLV